MDSTRVPGGASISYYHDGFTLQAPRGTVKASTRPATKRGTIVGWSGPSRRRFRLFMLRHGPEIGATAYGVTLTIPGPVMDRQKEQKLFRDWLRRVERLEYSGVWRVEIQRRQALHWHLLLYTSRSEFTVNSMKVRSRFGGAVELKELWWEYIKRMGPEKWDPPFETAKCVYDRVESRMELWGSLEHAAIVEMDSGDGCWKRYLQDHASKGKQDQIPENIGRHWGVVGRKRLQRVDAFGVDKLSDRQYFAAVRVLQRLATPQVKAKRPHCPFGRRLGRRVRRGSWGLSVWYSNPETCRRVSEWAHQVDTVGPMRTVQVVEDTDPPYWRKV